MTTFDAKTGLIRIDVEIEGPTSMRTAILALDTGATRTLLSTRVLGETGYELDSIPADVKMRAANGVAMVRKVTIKSMTALEQRRESIVVIAHDLPEEPHLDGLLGLDFFRGLELRIDFRNGLLELQ